MAMAAVMLVVWAACSAWILSGMSNAMLPQGQVCSVEGADWRTSLAKARQQIAVLPENHPLRSSEDLLRANTDEYCSSDKGKSIYDRWKREIGSKFKFEQTTEAEKEEYLKLLFQFRRIFDVNPKAPRAIKGVECALYLHARSSLQTSSTTSASIVLCRMEAHGAGDRYDAAKWNHSIFIKRLGCSACLCQEEGWWHQICNRPEAPERLPGDGSTWDGKHGRHHQLACQARPVQHIRHIGRVWGAVGEGM